MRWFLVDRFLELRKGKYAKALKNVSLGESYLHGHFPGFPVMPNTLLIESCAQTGGVLVGDARDFKDKVILAKVEEARFERLVLPGDQVILEAHLLESRPEGSRVTVQASVNGQPVATVRIMFIYLQDEMNSSLPKENFVFNEKFMTLLRMSSLAQERSTDA